MKNRDFDWIELCKNMEVSSSKVWGISREKKGTNLDDPKEVNGQRNLAIS